MFVCVCLCVFVFVCDNILIRISKIKKVLEPFIITIFNVFCVLYRYLYTKIHTFITLIYNLFAVKKLCIKYKTLCFSMFYIFLTTFNAILYK